MARRPTVSIVGCGRAGGAIGLALKGAGYQIAAAYSHSRAGRQRAHRLLEVPVLSRPAEVANAGDVVVVSVPDGAISDVAPQVAEGIRPRRFAVHTSGAVSIEALAAVRDAGARIGSMHPLQTLPDARRGARSLQGAAVAVTCADADRGDLHRLARGWGGRPFALEDAAKTRYHAAAVFASNYLVTAAWAASILLGGAGVGDPRPLLGPLIAQTAANIAEAGPERAITGPVVRGDADVVRRHLDELDRLDAAGGHIHRAYASMAELTAYLVGADPKGFVA